MTDELKRQFTVKGYVKLPACDQDQLSRLREYVSEGLRSSQADLNLPREKFARFVSVLSTSNQGLEKCVLELSESLHTKVSPFQEVKQEPVSYLAFIKSKENPYATHAHQDISYEWKREIKDRATLTTWIALDDCGPQSGGLSFLPESHRKSVSVSEDYLTRHFSDRQFSSEWKECAESLEIKAGEMAVFDCRVWHAAPPLNRDGTRHGIVIRWHSPSLAASIPVPEPTIDPKVFGMYTSGRLFKDAILSCLNGQCDEDWSLLQCVQTLMAAIGKNGITLDLAAVESIENYLLAQRIYSHAKIKADDLFIWKGIRDCVIPSLQQFKDASR